MKALQVHAEDQQKLIYAVDKEGKSLDQAVEQWMAQHEIDWQDWVKEAQK